MSDEIGRLSRRYRNRKRQLIFYILGFIAGFVILILIGNNYQIEHFVLISILVLCGFVVFLVLLFNILMYITGYRLDNSVSNKLNDWQYEMVEESINQIKTSTPVSIERIATVATELLFDSLKRKYPELNLLKISINPQDTIKILYQILAKKPSLGVYYQVENIFVKQIIKEQIKIEPKSNVTCFYCGFPMEIEQEICNYCKENSLKCVICKLSINFGDAVGSCSLCEAKGHLAHMQEWIKIQGKCPVCLQALPIEGVVPEEIHKAKKK